MVRPCAAAEVDCWPEACGSYDFRFGASLARQETLNNAADRRPRLCILTRLPVAPSVVSEQSREVSDQRRATRSLLTAADCVGIKLTYVFQEETNPTYLSGNQRQV